ncbi:hypothetical protein DBV15_09864 [Temnothorax longispinosus]|uniref:Uncharacterized protein n=1 Tax=Temnothorax longispinosus TaxID=300112 RepID=A0A4V3SCL8_9HYME|nr:hypothetical protein DBV15_09864 [Temnothorax longispinosus]
MITVSVHASFGREIREKEEEEDERIGAKATVASTSCATRRGSYAAHRRVIEVLRTLRPGSDQVQPIQHQDTVRLDSRHLKDYRCRSVDQFRSPAKIISER